MTNRIKLKADDIEVRYYNEKDETGLTGLWINLGFHQPKKAEQLKKQILDDFNTGKFLDRYGVKGLEQFKELKEKADLNDKMIHVLIDFVQEGEGALDTLNRICLSYKQTGDYRQLEAQVKELKEQMSIHAVTKTLEELQKYKQFAESVKARYEYAKKNHGYIIQTPKTKMNIPATDLEEELKQLIEGLEK